MHVEQFVMAYGVEQDLLRAILPDGFTSLRPVLRINAELRDETQACLEFNTAVEKDGLRGWLNIGHWDGISFVQEGKSIVFQSELLTIRFTRIGIEGGCPAERDNCGCFFPGAAETLRPPEQITSNKEFCDCEFQWRLAGGAHGVSIGKTLPAYPTPPQTHYPRDAFTVQNAARIPCTQVLGSYAVSFIR